jgi:epoxide hydrolase-like predicted phosphatase
VNPTQRPADGLLLDFGGVLTTSVTASFAAYERAAGLPEGIVIALLLDASRDAGGGLVGRLERGELRPEAFETELRSRLEQQGHHAPSGSLLTELFAGLRPDETVWELADRVRAAGRPIGLLSNSWGSAIYPWERLRATFDVLVVSGEVGLRKPDPAIYALAAERLALPPSKIVFVDDLGPNVAGARACGMIGIQHRGDGRATIDAVLAELGLAVLGLADRDPARRQ